MQSLVTFRKDEAGAAMVEFTIVMTLLFTLTLGFVDFGYALYQWNAATKAVEAGARLASISAPVAPEITTAGLATSPGDPIPVGNYNYTCNGATSTCTCTGAGCVAGTFTLANFNRIFRGDASGTGTCPALAAGQRPGMCHFFPRLQPANVVVKYTATGLGYYTRAGGSVPTISVSLQNVTFQFFFLGGLLGFNNITMPSMLSTATGEDMKSTWP
ncbi:pilus assembly protein [Mesorhizobium sp. CA15]|uniref:TadE/TadG family type IV pilus assembly protein n=1 Tax=unclassified Mesorhizobium TaxID=325217 RepID=UPI001CCB1FDC|nr:MULTISPECIES: TadE/TadG family type IV pilus assembly protein [unclassified Mesorhizobium]MBZ9817691.1 pilus assembly protein [Mesorhizobium sp. CA7]MBZ9866444.1 pilus assembly protein [Mesorhizobium sp. CA15]